jgi:hypothetical protein
MLTMVIEGGQEFVFDVLKMRSVGTQSVFECGVTIRITVEPYALLL